MCNSHFYEIPRYDWYLQYHSFTKECYQIIITFWQTVRFWLGGGVKKKEHLWRNLIITSIQIIATFWQTRRFWWWGGGYPKNVSLICRTGVYTIETHPKIQMPKFLELRELSYMTSAYFWPFLTPPPPCQQMSALVLTPTSLSAIISNSIKSARVFFNEIL